MAKVYEALAQAFIAKMNCERSANTEWELRHADKINRICQEYLPRGSGFDSGTEIDWNASRINRLVFITAFHHMNDGGMYDGWTHHNVILTPDLAFRFDVRITGKNRNDIKDYMSEVFSSAFNEDLPEE
jgi:hypothetical protein